MLNVLVFIGGVAVGLVAGGVLTGMVRHLAFDDDDPFMELHVKTFKSLAAENERLNNEIEGVRLWIKEAKKLYDARGEEIEELKSKVAELKKHKQDLRDNFPQC